MSEHVERWGADQPEPAHGIRIWFRVLEEEWDTSTEPPIRIIKKVEILGCD